MRRNNIDLDAAAAFAAEVQQDPAKALKQKRVEGAWNLAEGMPQFTAVLEHANGTTTVEADGPPFLGGSGLRPDPVQYCLFGLAACFAQTLASIAAEQGIELRELRVVAENRVNLLKPLGLGEQPVVERVQLTVSASADRDLGPLIAAAKERCPGVYCLTKPIPLEVSLKQQ